MFKCNTNYWYIHPQDKRKTWKVQRHAFSSSEHQGVSAPQGGQWSQISPQAELPATSPVPCQTASQRLPAPLLPPSTLSWPTWSSRSADISEITPAPVVHPVNPVNIIQPACPLQGAGTLAHESAGSRDAETGRETDLDSSDSDTGSSTSSWAAVSPWRPPCRVVPAGALCSIEGRPTRACSADAYECEGHPSGAEHRQES